jgi:hypothetical protein
MTCRLPALGLLLAAVVATAGGCIFDTREPEPPSTQAINYLPRSSAANVWENCRLALVNKDIGGWDTAVAEDFQYAPDGETQSAYPGVDWQNWDKQAELDFINSWFATDVTIEASLRDSVINAPDGSGGFAEWDLIYLLTVTDNQTGSTTRYRGRCILEFSVPDNFWYVSYWRDEQGEVDPETGATLQTMGALRGAFAP